MLLVSGIITIVGPACKAFSVAASSVLEVAVLLVRCTRVEGGCMAVSLGGPSASAQHTDGRVRAWPDPVSRGSLLPGGGMSVVGALPLSPVSVACVGALRRTEVTCALPNEN